MFRLKPETVNNIRDIVGRDVLNGGIDYDEEIRLIEQKINKKIEFPKPNTHNNRIGRGNPLLARHKIKTMQDVNRSLDKIK